MPRGNRTRGRHEEPKRDLHARVSEEIADRAWALVERSGAPSLGKWLTEIVEREYERQFGEEALNDADT